MKDGLNIEAKIKSQANYLELDVNISKGTPYIPTFWYVIGTIAMFFQFLQVQGLAAVEIVQIRDKNCGFKIRITYFASYFIVNTWYQMIGLYIATTFNYFEFFSVVGRIFATFSLLFVSLAFLYFFVTPYVQNRKFLMWFCYTCTFIAYFANIVLIIYPIYCRYVLFVPSTFIIFTYFWILIVMLNSFFKVRIGFSRFASPIICLFICIFGMQSLRPSEYYDGYSFWTFVLVLISNLLIVAIMIMQFYFGSRFFFPNKCRKRVYDKLTRKLTDSNLLINDISCQLCMNGLNEPELEYSDNDSSFKWKKHNVNEYILTKCNHRFHHNCLLKYLRTNHQCPCCTDNLPDDEFDD